VTRFLLDTNIISNLIKPVPSPSLVAWMGEQADADLFISALTVAEVRRGILEQAPGKKRRTLEEWFLGADGLQALFADRILPFDEKAAVIWAELMADGRRAGRQRNALDMIIAAVAQSNGCVLVTDNEKDFSGLKLLNPLRRTD
jgi:predicted nucleic acid-binding protein